MPQLDLPDCPSCDSDGTLEIEWSEMGSTYCVCSCCAKRCRVDHDGRVHKVEPRKTDICDNEMFEP